MVEWSCAMKLATLVLCAFIAVGVLSASMGFAQNAEPKWKFDPKLVDAGEAELLSGELSPFAGGGIVCKSWKNIDDILWLGGPDPTRLENEMIAEGKCMHGGTDATVRLRGIVGWAMLGHMFFCEFKVDFFLEDAVRPDPKFVFTAKNTVSPYLLDECHKFRSL